MKKYLFSVLILPALIFSSGVPAYSYTPGINSTGLYRLFNPKTGEHFYTASSAEEAALGIKYDNINGGFIGTGNFNSEGVAGSIFRPTFPNQIPLYRMYNPVSNRHFYTTSDAERDIVLKQGFTLEGIEGYLASTDDSPTGATLVKLYRLYNVHTNDHFYTKSTAEADAAVQAGYVREGSMGYVAD